MPAPPSASLLDRAKRGDRRAFEQLIESHIDRIRRMAYGFCRSTSEADDLAQDALLKAYRSLSSFRGSTEDGTFPAWLFTVARNVCNDWYRRQKSRHRDAEVPTDDERDVSPLAGPESLLTQKTRSERLWAAIRSLEPAFRVPLILFEVEGLSYQDIARVEGVAVGTIRSRLSRARTRLGEMLSESERNSEPDSRFSGSTEGAARKQAAGNFVEQHASTQKRKAR